jgi:hypothetical protein
MNLVYIRARALRHKVFVRCLSGIAPYYLVNEFPKSGGTWLSQMLASVLELPFRRNQPIRLEPSVTHGHFLNTLGLRNTVVLWRDPRDVIVSFYYHCYFVNEHGNDLFVSLMRKKSSFTDYSDIRANLPEFIRILSEQPISPRFSWPEFAKVWGNRTGTVQTSYEALRRDTPTELTRIVYELTGRRIPLGRAREVADKYDFNLLKAQSVRERSAVTEVSFIREGALGGWRQHFSSEAEEALKNNGYIDAMRMLGYFDS